MLTLIRRIVSPRRYLHGRHEVVRPVARTVGPRQWVLSRGLCLYRRFVLADVPAQERNRALEVRVRQWSPYVETGRHVCWRDEQALVWIWDERLRRDAAAQAGCEGARVVPETVLRPCPPTDTVRLAGCIDGFEGQLWRGGMLHAARWWSGVPGQHEWAQFLLANDMAPAAAAPPVRELPWQVRPWGRTGKGTGAWTLLRHEGALVGLAASLVVLIFAWEAGGLWQWRHQRDALAVRVQALGRQVEPVLAARNQAIEARRRVERLSAIVAAHAQLSLLAAVTRLLPPEVSLHAWRYQGGQLGLTLKGPSLDPAVYVKKLLEYPWCAEVAVDTGNHQDTLTLRVKVREP